MPYIGNQSGTTGFSKIPAKQDLTGATGTSLTLTHAVASAEGIDLFINNVRQEPTEAYSVGSDGVTVTLTGSVVATDDIYVVYNSLAQQTSTHPSNQALQATSGAFSSTLAVTGATTATGGLNVGTVKEANGTNTALSIDSDGRVAKPQQIAFLAYKSTGGDTAYSSSTSISADMTSTEFNAGGHYQTSGSDVGKFIAPITGYYFIGCNLFNNTTGTTRVNLIRESDGLGFAGQSQSSTDNDINFGSVIYLTANDKVLVKTNYAATIYHGSGHSYFYGYFIG